MDALPLLQIMHSHLQGKGCLPWCPRRGRRTRPPTKKFAGRRGSVGGGSPRIVCRHRDLYVTPLGTTRRSCTGPGWFIFWAFDMYVEGDAEMMRTSSVVRTNVCNWDCKNTHAVVLGLTTCLTCSVICSILLSTAHNNVRWRVGFREETVIGKVVREVDIL